LNRTGHFTQSTTGPFVVQVREAWYLREAKHSNLEVLGTFRSDLDRIRPARPASIASINGGEPACGARCLEAVPRVYDGDIQMIDSSSIRVSQHAANTLVPLRGSVAGRLDHENPCALVEAS
jgi:hypothetical protein